MKQFETMDEVAKYAARYVTVRTPWRLRLARWFLRWAEPMALAVLRRSGYWTRINTIERADEVMDPRRDGATNHAALHAYERGRHNLVWSLMHPGE